MPRDWDAETYERVSTPQERMGRAVLDRLALRGDERVLDAGCGTGRVTAILAERLPEGQVVAVDGSPSMIEQLRERLPQAEAHVADLLELELDEPVDAVISTATFHWIDDHQRLFERIFAALRPGGRFEAQCGGRGNISNVVRAIEAVDHPALRGWSPWNYASPEETAERLERAGFTDVECWLHDEPVEPPEDANYMRTIVLGSHVERLPEDDRDAFVRDVIAHLPDPLVIDYVRLNISATRA
jgi:trans-aconitate 2-methyltransferase